MFYSRELTQRINLYSTNGNILDNNEANTARKQVDKKDGLR